MPRKTLLRVAGLIAVHIALVAPFVPLSGILPAGLGALSMTAMAASLVLAARWRLVDRLTGGPDKSYGAHRWLGICALGGALGHWALADFSGPGLVPFLADGGEGAGTIAATGLIVMTAAAMVRAIPYHLWKASHMVMGPIFVLGAFHTLFVASPLSLGTLPWAVMALASVLGCLAWAQTLWRKATPSRLVRVASVERFEGGVDVTLRAEAPLPRFRPGQFSTLAWNEARAEAHPFTIAGGTETERRFVIRAAGDWTDAFMRDVTEGDQMRLGRGVGRFLPQTGRARSEQVWVAGGVGITPFLAALEKMEPDQGPRVTLLYYIRSRESAGVLCDVERRVLQLPQVHLHAICDADVAGLNPDRLADILRETGDGTQVYLCGPEGLKNMIVATWAAVGKSGRIHSERFDFRGAYGLSELIYLGKPMVTAASDLIARQRTRLAGS
ncbi:ferredoxin reductase family protein [Dinoroseobacter sp. S375]|uniref:ferredoxin reductase family protein n=1 Tax=Dinoroseobacter sp. S375 TaxID=3415136 RepID=UPI003C7A4839